AVERRLDRLERRLDQRERAEELLRGTGLAGAKRDSRQRQQHVHAAADGVVDERRRVADHLLELVVGYAARLERVDDDVYDASGLEVGLLHDPAAEACGFFPGDVAERVAADVLAEGVDLRARARTIRRALVADQRAELLARRFDAGDARKDDDLAVQTEASLLEKEAERIARVRIERSELHQAAAAEEKRRD